LAKKIVIFVIIFIGFVLVLKAQSINVSGIVTTGRFNTCGITPTITATLLSGNGSIVQNGALACINPSDTSIVNITVSNLRWDQNPGNNWLHGLFFPTNTGITILNYSLSPASWIYTSGCTGACPTGGGIVGSPGIYFVGTGQSCCPGGGSTPTPCDNYGDASMSCATPFTFSINMRILNSKILNSLTFKFRGSSDGNTGCWQTADLLNNEFVFRLECIPCSPSPFLCNPIATTVLATGLAGPYQWQNSIDSIQFNNIIDNSNYTGTNSSSLNLSNISSNRYGEQFRCIANGITGQLFTLTFRNSWTGLINTDWNTAGNWSCNAVPDANTDVFINGGNVVLNSNTIIRSLTIRAPATLTTNTGVVLTILH
jgi:hypothetical protein